MRARHSAVLSVVVFAVLPAVAMGWGNSCKFTAERAAGVDAKGVEKVVIRTGAGDLKAVGRATAVRIEARGVACATKQQLLDAANISVRREGNVVYVETDLPQNDRVRFGGDDEYASIDIGIALPADLPVEAIDSSGDSVFVGMRSLTVQDSSGSLSVSGIAQLADITDSSGELHVADVGSVRLRDSSGDIEVRQVRGDVEVVLDSSGDMRIANVDGAVKVDQDSSGGIRIEDVKGSVLVSSDSSGDIHARRIGGDFTVNEDSSGSIGHEGVRGKVTTPDHGGRSGEGDYDVE